MLGPAYDIELVEAHHRYKKDAPSGTALSIARALCDATDRSFDRDVRFQRVGHDAPRATNEITVQTLRLGDVVGEHTVMFGAPGERMELKHIGTNRDSYATGALHAAAWLARQTPGRYTMPDVLGL
jgi:4-hydroxy-tetrahydrodipicolinate reductase